MKSSKRETPPKRIREYPCLPELAVDILDMLVRDKHVCEVGSGGSTLWLAKRVRSLLTIEDDRDWYMQVKKAASVYAPVLIVHAETAEMHQWIKPVERSTFSEFDVVFVDPLPHQTRHDCILAGAQKVKPGGWLVADDHNFKLVKKAVDKLASEKWEVYTVYGWKNHPIKNVPCYSGVAYCKKPLM